MDDQSWKGLKETAGSSSQVRHHVGAVRFLFFFLFCFFEFRTINEFYETSVLPFYQNW